MGTISIEEALSAKTKKNVVKKKSASENGAINASIYTLYAKGVMYTDLVGHNACGGTAKDRGYTNYEVEADVQNLDKSNGFIFDSTLVNQFEQMYNNRKWQASCEQLCAGIINQVVEWADGRAERVKARVYNAVGFIQVEWRKGQTLPQGPVVPTEEARKADKVKRERDSRPSLC